MNDSVDKTANIPLVFQHKGQEFRGIAAPLPGCDDDICYELDITLNDQHIGTVYCGKNMKWKIRGAADQELVDKIGSEIALWYE